MSDEKKMGSDSQPRRYRTFDEFQNTFYGSERADKIEDQSASFGKRLAKELIQEEKE